jgi:serine protease Do
MLAAFQEVVAQYWTSTVRLYQDQTPLAMGVIVDSQGWVVTKASQLVDEPMECQLSDGRRVPAELRRTYPDLDLALVKLPVAGLAPVSLDDWASPRVGGWLATVDAAVLPLAIGVVSTPPRAIQAERAVLGVGLGPVSGGAGATVNMVLPGSGAEAAGLEVGDRLLAIDGRQVAGQEEAFRRIKQLTAGQRIVLDVQRGDAQMSFKAQVMDLNQTLLDPTEMEVNGLISARATGFERVFQHDTVLSPDQCGGLVVDLQGRPIGLNIARAGRVNSYALPSEVVVPAIRRMLAELPTRPSDYAGNGVAQAPADSQPPGDGATRRISLPAVD